MYDTYPKASWDPQLQNITHENHDVISPDIRLEAQENPINFRSVPGTGTEDRNQKGS